ncbi:MAG: hypothetical protein AAF787_14915 [Chloroflexota bacterium]
MQYTCVWIIDDNDFEDIVRLYDIAADHGFILWRKTVTSHKGYSALKFFVEVSDEFEFLKFVERCESILRSPGLMEWKSVSESEEEKPLFDKPFRLSELSGNLHSTFWGALQEAAHFNQKAKDRKQSE